LARAEKTLANFAYDHHISEEDKDVEQLLETDKTCELSQDMPQQIRSYFTLLFVGSRVPGSTCRGLNVSPRSNDPQDHAKVEGMEEKARLDVKEASG